MNVRLDAPKRILFVTGTRADYGKLKSVMRAVDAAPDFECTVFATGMHLLGKYGRTWMEIEKDGLSDIFLHFNQDHHTDFLMDRVLADTIRGLSLFLAERPIDLIVVHGDRVEALAAALVGSLNGILVAHIEGGELSGTVDELLRHSITKMSHLHFVSNERARDRVVAMGEYSENVFVVGSPNIDIMLSDDLPPLYDVRVHYEIRDLPFALFALHPVVGESDGLYEKTGELLDALGADGRYVVALYPNNDPGSSEILEALVERQSATESLRVIPSMNFESYLSLLRDAQVLIGNTSSGVHEAPVYGVPTVNIGPRQRNRSSAASIANVPFDVPVIMDAVRSAWGHRCTPISEFGDGESATRVLEVLRSDRTWETQVLKQFRDASG